MTDGVIAIVCPGPSLTETWEGVRAFPVVMAVKAAHEFLIERGIVPQYAVSTEDTVRTKWVKHEGVQYLCGVAGTKQKYGGRTLGPPGDWCSKHFELWRDMRMRQCPSGYYAVFCAHQLGFREIHLFGFDGKPKAAGGQVRGLRDKLGLTFVVHGPNVIDRRAA